MDRSRSKTRKGNAVGRPKRSTNQKPSYADVAAESANRSEPNPKRMRVTSPISSSSQNGNSSSQPQPRRKSMTDSRKLIVSYYIQVAHDSPRKHGKVGSLQWMNKVLEVVNHGAAEEKDGVTNLDLIGWLEKHFEIKVEDMTRSMHMRTRSRSRSNERASSDRSQVGGSSRDGSPDEDPTLIEKAVGRKKKVITKSSAKAATSQAASEPRAPVQGGAKKASKAKGKSQGAVVQEEAENSPESAPIAQGASSSVKLAATSSQGAGTSVEALAANVPPSTGTPKEAAASPPVVVDLDEESNADGSNGSRSEDDNLRQVPKTTSRARWGSTSSESNLAGPDGSGIQGTGEQVGPVAAIPPESPIDIDEVMEQPPANPAVGNRQMVVVSPEMHKLTIQLSALKLQIQILQKEKRYSEEQIGVLVAQANAMDGMVNLLTKF